VALAYPSSGGHVEWFLKEILKILGIDLIGIRGSGHPCLVVNIMSRRGSRRAYTSRGPRIDGEALSSALDTGAEIIHVSGYILELAPLGGLSELLKRARGRSRVCVDLFPRVSKIGWDSLSAVLSTAHVVLGNRSELQSLGGGLARAIEKILGLGVEAVVAKMGSAGAILYTRPHRRVKCSKTKRVETPLTTKGAGDVFNAAFIGSLYEGSSYEDALERACTAASDHVRGGGPLMKALEDIYFKFYNRSSL